MKRMNGKKTPRLSSRFLCAALCVLMLIPALSSCASRQKETEPTETKGKISDVSAEPAGEDGPGEETNEADPLYDANGYLKDSLPELDFGGQTVSVLYWSDAEDPEFDVEEFTGEIVNDAIRQRNIDTEDRLHIVYNWVGTPGNNSNKENYLGQAQASVQSGDGAYDIFASYSRSIGATVVNNLTRTLQDSEYLDFEKPWWPNNMLEESTIHDRLYFVSGDISTNLLHIMYCFFYNRELIEDYQLEAPTDLVFEGTWTVDKLISMTSDAFRDLNGNGRKDPKDAFGFTLVDFHNDAFYSGAGLRLLEKDPDEVLKVSEDFYGDRAVDLLAKLGPWEATNVVYLADEELFELPFTEGRALFTVSRAHYAANALRDTELVYGILPVPKFDEHQESYRTIPGNPITLYAVSIDSRIPDIAEAVLECMGSEAYRLTTPAIFENNMKKKYSVDDINAQMYDIVRGSLSFELARFFNQYLNGITDIYFHAVTANSQNWASESARIRRPMDKTLQKMVDKILKNEENEGKY